MFEKTLATLLLIIILAGPVRSQQNPPSKAPSEPQDIVRVETAAVQMDVIVTDKNGQRIKGLGSSAFQVLDEGVPQKVDYFTAIEGSRVTAVENRRPAAVSISDAPVTPLTTPFRGRHIALVFDDLSLSPDNFLRSRRALEEYVNTKLTPNDMTAIISTGGSLGSLQQFTNDKIRLLSALNRIASLGTPSERVRDRRFNITVAEAVRIDAGDENVLNTVVLRVATESLSNQLASTSNLAGDTPGSDTARQADREALKNQVRGAARTLVAQSGLSIRNVLGTLKNLFNGMADLPGRKIVVLATESLSTLGMSSEDISNQLVQLAELGRRSGISVYGLDAGGLRTRSTVASEEITGVGLQLRNTTPELVFSDFENLSAARSLIAATGGQLFANTNDIVAGIERAVQDSDSYYVLGFKPALLDNKFHRLSISVKDKPDLIVRARRGYLAVNQETVRGTNAELAEALFSPVARLDLPLEVVANVVPKSGSQVVVTGFHIGRNYLTVPAVDAAQKKADYDILAWVFAAGNDKPVGIIKTTVSYDLGNPEALKKLKTEGFLLAHTFVELVPGPYQIRAVVREKASGTVGSNYQFFEVPDVNNKKATSLSSLVLTASDGEGFRGHNTFKSATEVFLRYIIYNLPKNNSDLAQRVRLLDNQGNALMDSPLNLSSTSAVSDQTQFQQGTRFVLPKARGRYALLVTLRDQKGKVDIERRADLIVE